MKVEEETNIYIDNFAAYGNNMASYPKSLSYVMTGEAGYIEKIPVGYKVGNLD